MRMRADTSPMTTLPQQPAGTDCPTATVESSGANSQVRISRSSIIPCPVQEPQAMKRAVLTMSVNSRRPCRKGSFLVIVVFARPGAADALNFLVIYPPFLLGFEGKYTVEFRDNNELLS